MRVLFFFAVFIFFNKLNAQEELDLSYTEKDSLFIVEFESKGIPDKILHAEPLYIDLIRDLGAHKGEKEWNFGIGQINNSRYDRYEALVEYEFAPIERVGFELELPINLYQPHENILRDSVPQNKIESFKLATQWTFLVSDKFKTSMALGYIHQFLFSSFRNFGNPLFTGNVYSPFLVAAKRWGTNYHTLIYSGPIFHQEFEENIISSAFQLNSNLHYMIPGTRNFIGLEVNKIWDNNGFKYTFRPQMRLGIADNLLVGVVVGVPFNQPDKYASTFFRIIWEPDFKHK